MREAGHLNWAKEETTLYGFTGCNEFSSFAFRNSLQKGLALKDPWRDNTQQLHINRKRQTKISLKRRNKTQEATLETTSTLYTTEIRTVRNEFCL